MTDPLRYLIEQIDAEAKERAFHNVNDDVGQSVRMPWDDWLAIREALADRRPAGWQKLPELLERTDAFLDDVEWTDHTSEETAGDLQNEIRMALADIEAAEGGEARPQPSDRETTTT